MGLQSKLSKQFVSRAVWSPLDWQREWSTWIDDVSAALRQSGRIAAGVTFTPQEWRILDVIQATASTARRANNMPGLRDALTRYRAAVNHFLSIETGSGNVAVAEQPKVFQPAAGERKSA